MIPAAERLSLPAPALGSLASVASSGRHLLDPILFVIQTIRISYPPTLLAYLLGRISRCAVLLQGSPLQSRVRWDLAYLRSVVAAAGFAAVDQRGPPNLSAADYSGAAAEWSVAAADCSGAAVDRFVAAAGEDHHLSSCVDTAAVSSGCVGLLCIQSLSVPHQHTANKIEEDSSSDRSEQVSWVTSH